MGWSVCRVVGGRLSSVGEARIAPLFLVRGEAIHA